MAGFPTRISRALLGPLRKDLMPARDHVYFVAARFFNLVFWQTAGLNVLAPRAGGLIASNALAAHEEAWHPDGGPAPTFDHGSTGHYRLVYASTYKDADDNDVVPALTRARGFVQGSTDHRVVGEVVGTEVHIRIFDSAGNPADADVWFEAF